MGRGSRHSNNAGIMNSEAMTYAETKTLGYGTSYERIGKDSIGNFYDCQLTLQPSESPVCTPWGTIFSKKAILENFIHQKKILAQNLKIWHEIWDRNRINQKYTQELLLNDRLVEFERSNCLRLSYEKIQQNLEKDPDYTKYKANQIIVRSRVNRVAFCERADITKCFWIPETLQRTESTVPVLNACPDKNTRCPITGKKLSLKDLTPLKFTKYTRYNDTNYIDPISEDVITNRSHIVCLRPTGEVMLYDSFKNFVEPEGIFHESDLIELQKGGTGYIGHDGKAALGSKHSFLGIGTGMTDLRGQHSGSSVKSGLVLL
eukprot:gnl/TRDRNA2_/TRDRNA2_177085_c0_seq2.p1 gnl/TRDRNA2_/TRDRNA2_177085_c0~~gnl/TRDRNA2_/TRDRNA2_177085_c0_seq2.p1  ORF type:complete len:318 (-),score=-28.33 gnl/TRDRNA2_/TRDRNA2_177085_c0_seq2:530-1483(-)